MLIKRAIHDERSLKCVPLLDQGCTAETLLQRLQFDSFQIYRHPTEILNERPLVIPER